MILFPIALWMGAAAQHSTHAATISPLAVAPTMRKPVRPQSPTSVAPRPTAACLSHSTKEVIPSLVPVGARYQRVIATPECVLANTPAGKPNNQVVRGGISFSSAPSDCSGSIVESVGEMRIRANQEIPAMPAESGLIRLQEEIEELEGKLVYLNTYVANAAADQVFTTEEFAGFQSLSIGALVQQQEVRRGVGFLSDAIGLAKTVLHAGAITPWTARQARERSEDRLRLIETPVNVIPFRRPDDIRVS